MSEDNFNDIINKDTGITDGSVVIINTKSDPMAKWFVVHTYSGHENKVATVLKQRIDSIGYTDKFFKILVPQKQK